jgi:hypothetical protein
MQTSVEKVKWVDKIRKMQENWGWKNYCEKLQISVEETPTGSQDPSGDAALVMMLMFWDTTCYVLVYAESHTWFSEFVGGCALFNWWMEGTQRDNVVASNPVLESIRALRELPLIRGELVFVVFSFGIFRVISISDYNWNLCPQAFALCSRPWRYIVLVTGCLFCPEATILALGGYTYSVK